ncbi:MAG: glycoside hydrolase family 27 protein [Bacteroidota bacterium]|nr:glycoside hydrolase family 27 protein [Bacteroidota bacterium]
MMRLTTLAALLSFSIAARAQKFENLAMTPPMGWNSWNTFAVKIDEKMVMDMADAMVTSGMRDAGYIYLVLDDGWMAMERDAQGNLVPDPQKFPHGIKAVADYVHSKGLKFGLYNCAGTKTCAGYPGTRGCEYQDARNYAAWEIDYLKFDWCSSEGINAREAYATMSKALRKAGRPIIFSLCEWGQNKPWEWAAPIGQLWRTTGDINPLYDGIKRYGNWHANGVMTIVDLQADLARYAGPGHWNDPDMLEVGNGMSQPEDRTHFSMWCMLAAPLISGNDLRKMSPQTTAILTNKEAIAIDQDPLGAQGIRYSTRDSVETWVKPLQNGDWAICFLNRSLNPKNLSFDWGKENIADSLVHSALNVHSTTYSLHDCWQGKNVGSTSAPLAATIPPHDVILLRLKK